MIFNSGRVALNRRRLVRLLQPMTLLDFDQSAALEFGRIKAELLRRGTIIPDVDAQIAAIARSRGLVLLTADAHFSHVSKLITEDWTRQASGRADAHRSSASGSPTRVLSPLMMRP